MAKDNRYLVIIEATKKACDKRLLELLRGCNVLFSSGTYVNHTDGKGCTWYLLERPVSLGDVTIGFYINGKYKAMCENGDFFESNCADNELPNIDDVLEGIREVE